MEEDQITTGSKLQSGPAEDIVRSFLVEYGVHTHQSQISNVIDGLKPVMRRILISLDDKRKVSVLTGTVMEKYHPYGDSSISTAITNLAKHYKFKNNLLESDSNIGAYSGANPAAPRYLPVWMSSFAKDIYFKDINHDVFEYVPCEIGFGLEPKYLVPKLPMSILLATFGIAIGHKSAPFSLNLGDVCDMVCEYVKILSEDKKVTLAKLYEKLAKYTLPDFPQKTLLLNKKHLLQEYSKGNYKVPVEIIGTYELTPSAISIRTLPPDVVPVDVQQKMGAELVDKKPNFINQHFTEARDNSGPENESDIICMLKRGVSPFTVIDRFISFTGGYIKRTPSYLYSMSDSRIAYLDPIKVLIEWYKHRVHSIRSEARTYQNEASERLRIIDAFFIIGDDIDKAITIIRNSKTIEEAAANLRDKFDISYSQAMAFSKYRLQSLVNQEREKLEIEKEKIYENIDYQKDRFLYPGKYISQDCVAIKEKYKDKCTRQFDEIKPIGSVTIDGGTLLFESMKEMQTIVSMFKKFDLTVMLFNRYKVYSVDSSRQITVISRRLRNISNHKFKCTPFTMRALIFLDDGCIFRMNKLKLSTAQLKRDFTIVGDSFIGVHSDGSVTNELSTTIPLRNKADAKGNMTDIIHISPLQLDVVIVAYLDMTNTVKLCRCKVGNKLIFTPKTVRKTMVLGVFDPNRTILIKVPAKKVSKTSVDHILIEDSDFITDKFISIKLSASKGNGFTQRKVGRFLHLSE